MKVLFKKLFVFFSAFVISSFSLTFANGNNKFEEARADTFNLVNTTAFSYIAGTSGSIDAHLVIHLTDNDYGSSTQFNYNDIKTKLDALDFINHICINGKSLNFDSYNADGFKFGSEIHINTLGPTDGTFSVRINFNGSTTSDIQTIKIMKDCQMPSQGYLNDTSTTIYTLASEINSYPESCNWDWITYMDTEVYGVSVVENTYLGLQLSVNDYIEPNGVVDGTIGNSFTNYASYVTCDNGAVTVYNGYGLLSYNDAYDAIWIRTSVNSNTISTINVSAGTILPSYHGVKATPNTWPLYFRVTQAHTFTKNASGAFPQVFEKVNTEVERVDFTSINDAWLSFALSESDYVTFRQATFASSAQYNFWSNIIVIDSSDNELSLYDICAANAHIFNFNNENEGEFSVNINSPYSNQGRIKKIIIPVGTEFPQYSYLSGGYHSRPKAYVTTVEKEFIYGTTRKFAEALETSITGMGYNVNGYLGFVLSNNDYPALGTTDGGIESIYSTFYGGIDISDIGLTFNSRYSLWSYNPLDDSVAPQVVGTLRNGIVNIPAGTLFPSYEFTVDNNIDPIVYKVSDDVSFLYNGTRFIDITERWSVSNTITGLETHGTQGSNDFAIDIMLSEYDWPSGITNLDLINNGTYGDSSYKSHYNTFNKIKAYDSSDNLLPFTSEIFVNVWGKTGCLSIRLGTPSTNMQYLAYIRIDAGLELPTYNGFYVDQGTRKFADKSYYLINDDYLFIYDQQNCSFLESNFLEETTTVTSIMEVEPTAQNSIISFALSVNDYSNNLNIVDSYRTSFNSLNIASYITINGIKLSELSGFNSTDISISNTGKVSIRTPGNNTGYYYIDSGNRVYTNNLTKYEIRIAKGCQFPSYHTLIGSASIGTCYVTTQDYNFAWFNGAYVLEDNQFSNLEVEDLTVSNVGYCSVNSSDRCIYIPLSGTDWPTSPTVNGDIKNTVACPDFLSHVEVYDVDGDLHLPTTNEVFINVWGTGTSVPSIGFRTDIASVDDIKSVIIYEDCLVPSYDKYLGNSDSWYLVTERTAFYSSLDGSFYKGNDLTAIQYASSFVGALSEVCTGYDGVSSNLVPLTNKFYAFKNIYSIELTSSVKNELKTSDDDTIIQMYTLYDYVVLKYGLENFLESDFTKGNNNNSGALSFLNADVRMAIIYVVVGMTIIIAAGALIFVVKRKRAV